MTVSNVVPIGWESRIKEQTTKTTVGFLSAYRFGDSPEETSDRTQKLWNRILSLKYGILPLTGHWDAHTPYPVDSYLVVRTHGGRDDFIHVLLELAAEFSQPKVLVVKPRDEATYHYPDGSAPEVLGSGPWHEVVSVPARWKEWKEGVSVHSFVSAVALGSPDIKYLRSRVVKPESIWRQFLKRTAPEKYDLNQWAILVTIEDEQLVASFWKSLQKAVEQFPDPWNDPNIEVIQKEQLEARPPQYWPEQVQSVARTQFIIRYGIYDQKGNRIYAAYTRVEAGQEESRLSRQYKKANGGRKSGYKIEHYYAPWRDL